MIDSDKEEFKRLGFNEDQLHAADVLLTGIDGVVMSSDPNHMKKIREELGLKPEEDK